MENNERLLELRPGGNYLKKKSWNLRRSFPAKTIWAEKNVNTPWNFCVNFLNWPERRSFKECIFTKNTMFSCFCNKNFFSWKCQTKFPSCILSKIYTKNDENFSIQYDHMDPRARNSWTHCGPCGFMILNSIWMSDFFFNFIKIFYFCTLKNFLIHWNFF